MGDELRTLIDLRELAEMLHRKKSRARKKKYSCFTIGVGQAERIERALREYEIILQERQRR